MGGLSTMCVSSSQTSACCSYQGNDWGQAYKAPWDFQEARTAFCDLSIGLCIGKRYCDATRGLHSVHSCFEVQKDAGSREPFVYTCCLTNKTKQLKQNVCNV